MQELFRASDIDGNDQIDYEEFIAAMLDSNRVARRAEAVSALNFLHTQTACSHTHIHTHTCRSEGHLKSWIEMGMVLLALRTLSKLCPG
jgi:hypothetical protein